MPSPLDSLDAPENKSLQSSQDSMLLVEQQWKQQRRARHELHRVKAEQIFSILKEALPDENLYTLQIAFLTLLVPFQVPDSPIYKALIKHLVELLDYEVEIGLSSKQKESEATSPLP